MTNPFTFGNPVSDPARFYGRSEAIRQITNRLLSSAHESTSIVGERRIGKTSLLKYISNPEVAPGLGLTPDHFCLIYIDFQGLTDITPHRFWQRVLAKIKRSICSEKPIPIISDLESRQSFDLFDLEDLFETIAGEGLTSVLLLDEFEYITQNPKFGPDFFGGLRALAIHHDLPLVTATRRDLIDLCHSEELRGSPFFNIFANVVLRPMPKSEVTQMVEAYLATTGLEFSDEEKNLVYDLAGGYPFFVQAAGYYLVEARQQGADQPGLLAKVTTEFDQQADPHFSYLWTHCSESEKITLLAVMALNKNKPSPKTRPTLENLIKVHSRARLDVPDLVKRGLLIEVDGENSGYQLLSSSLERWITREISAGPETQESQSSVEEWLQSGGKDVVDPVKGALPKFKKKYWPMISTVLQEMSFELAGSVVFEMLIKTLL